ncbi:glycoside hydrolase family 43 protein [Bifidobacterium simiarum]|uniref:glycoside hydrolase family 43 protein n=1 Tax=Bifidobacterium simiarum TaxID=2045441 RepID=UPI001BDD6F83|nr:glycoside hydrolase family 43 protein [Bifidobacterium simiarum]MBT1165497.1 glycoside hydrolase family 43 protein [Bifidobacterium simiarum]
MASSIIHNPVLPGFNPDPVIFRDDECYHIIVSTFEWLPGLRIYSSDDLVSWRYETSVLSDPGMVELRGNPTCCSIWGPYAAYHNGRYYVVYTNVNSTKVPYKDCDNYIVTAERLEGPWSDPVYVNSSGFDPSLFFDDDGKAYFLNEIWDYRLGTHNKSAGVVMQRIDPETLALIGEPKVIFRGTDARKTEAPQIVKRSGYYYLLTAEGGTEAGHQETVARSRNIWGPYEVDPDTPLITAADDRSLPLQCAGHASLVRTDGDEWYMAYLCTRPFPDGDEFSILGRETAIQRVEWTDNGWLRLSGGGHHPSLTATGPRLTVPDHAAGVDCDYVTANLGFSDPLTGSRLDPERWNTLRQFPDSSWLDLTSEGMVIRGGQSPQSAFDQHLVATRQTAFDCDASVTMQYTPRNYMQLAGMTLYLDTANYVLFMITAGDDGCPYAVLQRSVRGQFEQIASVPVSDSGSYRFNIRLSGPSAEFVVNDGQSSQTLAESDIAFLSGGYTGNFIGLDTIDMGRRNASEAVFTDFSYRVSA